MRTAVQRRADNDNKIDNKNAGNNDDDSPIGHGDRVNKHASPPVYRVRCTF